MSHINRRLQTDRAAGSRRPKKLDWSYQFPVILPDKHDCAAYRMVNMYTDQMLKRSKYIARALKEWDPLRAWDTHGFNGIPLPRCSGSTFEYYKRCVETGDARVNMPLFTVGVMRMGYEDDFEDVDAEDDEQQHADDAGAGGDTRMVNEQNGLAATRDQHEKQPEEDEKTVSPSIFYYCDGYFFALAMEDCKTANLIIDALIAYIIDIDRHFTVGDIKRIRRNRARAWRLYDLVLDLSAMHVEHPDVEEVAEDDPEFWTDLQARVARIESENPGKSVKEALGQVVIGEEGRYHCFNELHPKPGQ